MVGNYPAPAIYGTVFAQCVAAQGVVVVNAVGVGQFSPAQAVEHVKVVSLVLSGLVGFLNAASGRRVVARHGEAYERAVGKPHRLLHKSFAETAHAHYGCAVLVL